MRAGFGCRATGLGMSSASTNTTKKHEHKTNVEYIYYCRFISIQDLLHLQYFHAKLYSAIDGVYKILALPLSLALSRSLRLRYTALVVVLSN